MDQWVEQGGGGRGGRVEFPAMRRMVMDALAGLADPDYQRTEWLHQAPTGGGHEDSLDEVVHALYDDSTVMADPEGSVGPVLLAGVEVARFRRLDAVLTPLIDRLGNVRDADYLADPVWPDVVEAAAATLATMVSSEGLAEPEGPFLAGRHPPEPT